MSLDLSQWISLPAEKAPENLSSNAQGLPAEEAAARLKAYGPNRLRPKKNGLIFKSKDLFVDEATLTGETFPVEKSAGIVPWGTPLARVTNALFMGTYVVSGAGKALVIATGRSTELGKISDRLKLRPPWMQKGSTTRRFCFMPTWIPFMNRALPTPSMSPSERAARSTFPRARNWIRI